MRQRSASVAVRMSVQTFLMMDRFNGSAWLRAAKYAKVALR